MTERLADKTIANRSSREMSLLARLARRAVLGKLATLTQGRVTLVERGARHDFGAADNDRLAAVIRVDDAQFYPAVAFGGSVGAGEAYMAGHWRCDDLEALVRILLVNRNVLDGLDSGWSRLVEPARRLGNWLNRNTRRGSRRNIAAHYDLGNALFELFLDPTMMYSSAIYADEQMTLDDAAVYKTDLVCRKLQLDPDDHLLEIGTGWGGLAIHAARHYGCRVTTTTLSQQQRDLAVQRIEEAGLSGRITVRLDDYRDLDGQYDKLVSIEMIEAVGHEWFDTYFAKCAALLRPRGRMVLQAITIADQRYDAARRNVDFIKKYIFPGGGLPSVAVIADCVARVTDMRMTALQDIGFDYARTVHDWRQRFFARLGEVRSQGYPEAFVRMWDFYLQYCEGAFRERAISTVQVTLEKP